MVFTLLCLLGLLYDTPQCTCYNYRQYRDNMGNYKSMSALLCGSLAERLSDYLRSCQKEKDKNLTFLTCGENTLSNNL